jgi:predicted transcriptional regulator
VKYRSSTEIMDAILRSVGQDGGTRTRIMYKSYLSYTQLNEYLSTLLQKDLLSFEQGTQLYRVTARGSRYLEVYSEIRALITTPLPDGSGRKR